MVSASDGNDRGDPSARALSIAEIQDLVQCWADAAGRADAAGFDVLEIHGAHGYLIHQFLSPHANRRTDSYGGSDANRMRFAISVVEAVRDRWPADKPLFLHLSVEDDAGWGSDESARLARIVKDLGVDVIDCSSGGMRGSPVVSAGPVGYGYRCPMPRNCAGRRTSRPWRSALSFTPIMLSDPAARSGRPDRTRPRGHAQPELAD